MKVYIVYSTNNLVDKVFSDKDKAIEYMVKELRAWDWKGYMNVEDERMKKIAETYLNEHYVE